MNAKVICRLQFQPIIARGKPLKTKVMHIDRNRADTRGSAYCSKGRQLSRYGHNTGFAGMKGLVLCFQRSSVCLLLLLLIGTVFITPTQVHAQEEETSLPSRFGPNGNLSPGKAEPPPPPRNPYTIGGGCLFSKGLSTKLRICNSEDILPDSIEQGYCRLPDVGLEYQEM